MKKLVTLAVLINILSQIHTFSIQCGRANVLSFSFSPITATTSALKATNSPLKCVYDLEQCSQQASSYRTCPPRDKKCSCTTRTTVFSLLKELEGNTKDEEINTCEFQCCHYENEKNEVLERLQVPKEVRDIFNFSYISFYDDPVFNKELIGNAVWFRQNSQCKGYVPRIIDPIYDEYVLINKERYKDTNLYDYLTPTCPFIESELLKKNNTPVFQEAVKDANRWKFTSLCFEHILTTSKKYQIGSSSSQVSKVDKIIEPLQKHIESVSCEKMKFLESVSSNLLQATTATIDEKFPYSFVCKTDGCTVVTPSTTTTPVPTTGATTTPVPTTRATTTPVPTTRATTTPAPTTRATTTPAPTTRATTTPAPTKAKKKKNSLFIEEEENVMAEKASETAVEQENALDIDWMD